MSEPAEVKPAAPTPRRAWHRRKRWRWPIRVLVLLPFLLGGLLLLLTRTPITKALLLPRLESMLGMDIDAGSVVVGPTGDLIVRRAVFRLRGLPGKPGEFVEARFIRVGIDWASTLGGSPRATSIFVNGPIVRISQDVGTGTLNIENLVLPRGSGSMPPIPAVTTNAATLEFGEHTAAGYTPLKTLAVNGTFVPSSTPGHYIFRLNEDPTRNLAPGAKPTGQAIQIQGTFHDGAVELTMDNVTLDQFPASAVPSRVRTIYQELGLAGTVSRTTMTYAPGEGVRAAMQLDNVSLRLPIEAIQPGAEGSRLLQMSAVQGSIGFSRDGVEADIQGLLEDLPYRVKLRYHGLDLEAPFEADFSSENFQVAKHPRLLPWVPPIVRERLAQFSGPTGVVNTAVHVSRGQPGGIDLIQVSGVLDVQNGSAAFDRFPYPFIGLAGRFRFTEDSIDIENVTGRSASGATLGAQGRISPLTDDAEFDLVVDVADAPIDRAMEDAFGPGRREIIAALFNADRYRELLDRGLVVPGEPGGAGADGPPAFAFRGKANVHVTIHRPLGADTEWQEKIEIVMPHAGLLPKRFPLPIHAEDVRVRVRDDEGELYAGRFEGLRGGKADVRATFHLPRSNEGAEALQPRIVIDAADIPLDDLLINALPDGPPPRHADQPPPQMPPQAQAQFRAAVADAPTDHPGDSAIKRILRDLRVTGRGAGTVAIAPRNPRDIESIGFDADIRVVGAEIGPLAGDGNAPGLKVGGIDGQLLASEDALTLTLVGEHRQVTGPIESLGVALDAQYPTRDGPVSYAVSAVTSGVDLAAPVEQFVRIFSREAAAAIGRVRAEYRPAGRADIDTRVVTRDDQLSEVTVRLEHGRDLSFDFWGGRVALGAGEGSATIAGTSAFAVTVNDLRAPMTFDGDAGGLLTISGLYRLTDDPSRTQPARLEIDLTRGRFESALTRRAIDTRVGEVIRRKFNELQPTGEYDATVIMAGGTDAQPAAQRDAPPRVTIRPKSAVITTAQGRTTISPITGEAEVEGGRGVLRGLRGSADRWAVQADASWHATPAGGVNFDAELSADGTGPADDLMSLLPANVQGVAKQIEARVAGPFSLRGGSLRVRQPGGDADPLVDFEGWLEFADASVSTGVEFSALDGRVHMAYLTPDAGPSTSRVEVELRGGRAAGVRFGNGRALIEVNENGGIVRVSEIEADCYAGRIVGVASADRTSAAPGAPREFTVDVRGSGVQFAPLLADLQRATAGERGSSAPGAPEAGAEGPSGQGPETPASAEARSVADPAARGVVDGELTLAGLVGLPESRRGRGSARVSGGRVMTLPVVPLIEVSNLQLPANETLDFAQARFFIDGSLITFDDLSIVSRSIEIRGYGTMTWPETELNLRFDSSGARRIWGISAIVEGIRNQLVTTSVTGRLGEQKTKLIQFPGARRALGTAMGTRRAERERQLINIQRRAGSEHELIRPSRQRVEASGPDQ